MATVTKTVTLIPVGNTGITNLTTSTSYPVNRGYNNTSNSSFARFTLSTSTTGYIYYTFDTSEIPAGATITSVTAKARAYVGNTTRVTNTVCQLYSGTTARGSNTTFASTSSSNIVTLSPGTGWTRALLNDLRIRIGATGSSSTSSKYVYFAGAEVVVIYTVTAYDITASGDGTIDPTSASVEGGGSLEIHISGITNPTVKDNNVDVTSQLTTVTEVTETGIPNGNTVSGFTASNITNAYADADSDTYADLTLAGRTTGTLYLPIGGMSIPSGATIKSVTAKATLQFVPGSSSSGFTASCQMYAGNTAKGSSTSVVSSSTAVPKTTFTLNVGTWTASEIANARFYLTATNNASSTQRHMYVFGVSFSVTYESDGVIYVYTLTNIQSNHVIVVTNGSGQTDTIYFKDNGSWISATKVYKKVNGSWVQQTDLTSVFSSNINYVKG